MSITLLLALVLICGVGAQAGIKDFLKKSKKDVPVDIFGLSLDDNLYTPEVDENAAPVVAEFQLAQARALKKRHKYNVELMRDGEVVVITIPAGQLFDPNDTILTELGKITLKPLLKYLKTADMYKMILAMHSDNTGSEAYTQNLCRARVNAIDEWVRSEAKGSSDYVVPYALGAVEPLKPNNSVDNRRLNRRLEIYLVPGNLMVKQAQKGDINL